MADGKRCARRWWLLPTAASRRRGAQWVSQRGCDFGKVAMVCQMEHDEPHEHVAAWEWF